MLENIVNFSIKNKLIIILFTGTVAFFGIFALFNIPVGAVPDITNNQVQVITTSPNLSTQDVEQFITYPVELEMANLPGVKEIRSVSKFGLSVVTIVFEDGMGTYLPRQLISEKILSVAESIPEGFGTPEMGPISTGLGEIYQYTLDTKPGYQGKYTPMEIRTIQDWIVKRQLSGIPGVVEINTWGGYLQQYQVTVSPERLMSMNITVNEVFEALEKNNSIAGGAYIERMNETYFIRGEGLIRSVDELLSVVVKNTNGTPVLIGDVATVEMGYANRFGAITGNGEGEKVLGQIMMLKDANSSRVIKDVKQRVAEVQETLPEGLFINPIVERSELISKTTTTVAENLIIGCIIVMVVVVLLLGDLRSGMVIGSLIPLCLLFTLGMMYVLGIDANLMSLGAIDFGIIIDGGVIIVEFVALKLAENKAKIDSAEDGDKRSEIIDDVTAESTIRMMRSAIFGQIIILVVFIPILSLTGVEGKMFRPMALTFSFALIGAIFFCFTWLPVASSMFLKPEKNKLNISERLMNAIYRFYMPVIEWSCAHKKIVIGAAVLSLFLTGYVFAKMGGEFIPTLDEGDFVIQPVLKTGTSLSATVETLTKMENILLDNFPEVEQVVSRIGAAEVPTDPMSMEESDVIIKLRPKREWVTAKSKDELANKFKEALSVIPGIDYEFTQPIEMRFNELITGVRADVAIKIFGDDIAKLDSLANMIHSEISGVEGAADIIVEKTTGLPQMSITYNRTKLARYGLNIEDVNRVVSAGFGGAVAGSIFEGEKRFDLVVRLNSDFRKSLSDVEKLYIDMPGGGQIPLNEVATVEYGTGPAKISRDNTRRRVVVSVNVRDRDMQSVVEDIQSIIDDNIDLPAGYSIDYGGQFENFLEAGRRLRIAVPAALLLIFILLHFAFKSLKEALLVFSAIPLATVGGVLLLWVRGMPFSISAGVGFIALFGIAVLNGIVLIEYIKELKSQGVKEIHEVIIRATRDRLRPVILTASAAALGFLPMAISTSAGAEVQRPLATVVIGGLITSTMLTLIALPLLYSIFDNVTGIRLFPLRLIRRAAPVILLLLVPFSSSTATIPVMITEQPAQGYSKVQPGQVSPLTADRAVEIALANNRELKTYQLQVTQAKALVKTAFSTDKTTVFYGLDENNIAANEYPLYVAGIEQSFEFPAVYLTRRKENVLGYEAARYQFEIRKRELEKNVRQSYFNIVFLLNKQGRLRYLDSLYSGFADAADKRYSLGESNYLELLNARSKKAQVQSNLKQIQSEIATANEQLLMLLQSQDKYTVADQPLPRLEISEDLIAANPEHHYFESQMKQSAARLQTERLSWLPDINLTYFRGTNKYEDSEIYLGWEVGLSVPLIFAGKAGTTKSAAIEKSIAEITYDEHEILVQAHIREKRNEVSRYNDILEYYNMAGRALSAEIIKTAVKSYDAGEVGYFEYIQSIENAIQIDMEYLEYLNMYNQSVLDLNYIVH